MPNDDKDTSPATDPNVGSRPEAPAPHHHSDDRKHGKHKRRMAIPVITAVVALVIGGAVGAGAISLMRPTPEMAPMTPVAISTMPKSSLITIKGTVAEIYGNKFILQDESGKALIETGPAGADGDLVTANEALTVQGRFEDGFVHASYLVHPDGTTASLRPPHGPPPGHRPHGPLADLANRIAP